MSCTSLPKAAKPVWVKHLTRLPCLVVYVKFQFVHTASKIGLVGFHQFHHPTWTGFWEGIQWVPWGKQCHPFCQISPTLATYPRQVASIPISKVNRESLCWDAIITLMFHGALIVKKQMWSIGSNKFVWWYSVYRLELNKTQTLHFKDFTSIGNSPMRIW